MGKLGKKIKKHNIRLNTMGGSYCADCGYWSNMTDGLEGEACEGRKEKVIITTSKVE